MTAWSEQPEREGEAETDRFPAFVEYGITGRPPTPPTRRFPIGSAEDDCLGLLVQLNAQADRAWMALYEGRAEDAAREVATLITMATRCGARLQERE